MTSLSIHNVTKSFDKMPVLRGVSLHVPESSFTAILGPSGCGKTTLLRLIAGFANPDSGTISLGDTEVFGESGSVPSQARHIGYVPQEGGLFPHLDVAKNITFGLPYRQRRSPKRVHELLELVGLDNSLHKRYPHQLSGGQQQRVALARALAPRPSMVLLDEPFASLDAALREGTGRAVAHALRAAGTTAVLVTHDQNEALSLADQVAVMRQGRLVQAGTPETVYGSPVDTGVAEFVGAAVILPASAGDKTAMTALGALGVKPGSPTGDVTVMLRPEQLELLPATRSIGTEATVKDVTYFGHDAFVHLQLHESGHQLLARAMGGSVPAVDTEVRIVVNGPVSVYARS